MGEEANEQIIDILKWGMLPWMAGKGPGDAQANDMHTSIGLVGGLQMMPEDSMIIDWPHVLTGDHLIIYDPLKQAAS